MKTRRRDQRVLIQTPTYAASAQSGQGVASWSSLATVWADVREVDAGESLVAGAVTSGAVYEVDIVRRPDLTPKMRVQWTPFNGTARTFEVHGQKDGPRRSNSLVLVCGEAS